LSTCTQCSLINSSGAPFVSLSDNNARMKIHSLFNAVALTALIFSVAAIEFNDILEINNIVVF
jgi:hypothetical protein